jgi:hypothetical protein
MKRIIASVFMLCFLLVSISSLELNYNETAIVSDVYISSGDAIKDYFTFIKWDLGTDLAGSQYLDIDSINATFTLITTGAGRAFSGRIHSINNQSIDLSANATQLYYHPTDGSVNYDFTNPYAEHAYSIDVSSLVKNLLWYNQSSRYITFRVEVIGNTSIVPDQTIDNAWLYIGSNDIQSNMLPFGSSTEIIHGDYKPKMKIVYSDYNPLNISVTPYEFRWLPQVNCNKTAITTGLQRRYLLCSYNIDGVEKQPYIENSGICPNPRINFTFTNNEVYSVSMDYAEISWNSTIAQWQKDQIGNCGYEEFHYNMNLPEPPMSLFTEIINLIWNWIKGRWCSLFGGAFCS